MFLRNICGYRIPPGAGDKGSIGYTFNVALAEDEDTAKEIGWPTYGMDRGNDQCNSGQMGFHRNLLKGEAAPVIGSFAAGGIVGARGRRVYRESPSDDDA